MNPLRLATRRSPLALAQSQHVADRLQEVTGRPVELVPVISAGDRDRGPLSEIGGVGVFVAAVRAAVLAGEADLAVHSLKDLPTTPEPGLTLAAVPPRADVRDALVSRDGALADLAPGSQIGTGSPRRAAQLRLLRPDLGIQDIRGNVDTRIELVDSGELAAVVLAMAGLQRLGRADRATEVLTPERMLPAPGQGALAVETRAVDPATTGAVAALDDPATRVAVTAERAMLRRLEAGCTAPVGALAHVSDDDLTLTAVVFGASGEVVRSTLTGRVAAPEELGREAADRLLADGADQRVEGAVR